MNKLRIVLILVVSFLVACREPYDPALENGVISYLVVEGNINANGITTIDLSRTKRLADKDGKLIETKAIVEIESDSNIKYPLTDKGDGSYTSASNILPRDRKYRIRIKTAAGKEYLSAFAAVKITQPVTLNWSQDAQGVDITVNSTDPSNNTRYYQWVHEEVWEINSALTSWYVVLTKAPNVTIRKRTPTDRDNAFRCWAYTRSGNILTATTTPQSDDVIKGFSLVKILNGSEKLAVKYSAQATQYAISREAYEFYEVMKKNTEKMGSVFDPQPSLVRGNISSTTDPGEIVIGFVECAVPAVSNRLFITSKEAGDWKRALVCQTGYVQNSLLDLRRTFDTDATMIADAALAPEVDAAGNEVILGYNTGKAECLDCRTRGNNIKPAFW